MPGLQPQVERRHVRQTRRQEPAKVRAASSIRRKRGQVLDHCDPDLQHEPEAGNEIPEGSLHGSDFPGWRLYGPGEQVTP